MFTYQRDAAQVAQFANQYNFDELVACLTDYLDPKAAAKHLKLIYFTLTEYILSDTFGCRGSYGYSAVVARSDRNNDKWR